MKTQEEWNEKRTKVTVYSRVVGWITPKHNWNKGKAAEGKDRVNYDNQANW